MKIIKTDRLILRGFNENDTDDLFELLGDEQTCLDDGGYHAYPSKDDPGFRADAAYLAKSEEHYAVEHRETGRMIGFVHIMTCDRGSHAAELGFVTNKAFRRQGYTKEAVRAVIEDLFSGDVRLIVCTCYEYNIASAKTMESLGFAYEGKTENSCDHPQKGCISSLSYTLEKK